MNYISAELTLHMYKMINNATHTNKAIVDYRLHFARALHSRHPLLANR